MPVTTYAETAIWSKWRVKRSEVDPICSAVIHCGAQKQPFPVTLRTNIATICRQISSTKLPRSSVLRDQEKQDIGYTLARLNVIEICGITTGGYGTESPLAHDLKVSTRMAEIFADAWPSVWAWLKWIHENWLVNIPPNSKTTECQQLTYNGFSNILAVYSVHGEELPKLISSAPGLMGIMALHHVRGNWGMYFAMRIQHITRAMRPEELGPYVIQMVEALNVDGKGGVETLVKATVQQLVQILDTPATEWNTKTTASIISQFGFLEGITLGHTGVRDALISAKVLPTTIRLINLYADGKVPIDETSAVIVRKAVSYIKSLHTVQKNCNWIAQAVKAGMIPAILKSARVTQDTRHSEHAEWMVKTLLPQCTSFYSLLKVIEKSCQTAEVQRLTRNKAAMSVLWEPWQAFLQFKHTRLALMERFDDNPNLRSASCAYVQCHKSGLFKDMKVCAQCKLLYYCSPACQKQHWDMHKLVCKYHQDCRHKESFPKLSSDDSAFLSFCCQFDATSNKEYIASLIRKHHEAGNSQEDTWIRIDYTEVPFTVSVSRKWYEGDKTFNPDVELPQMEEGLQARRERDNLHIRGIRYPMMMTVANGKNRSSFHTLFVVDDEPGQSEPEGKYDLEMLMVIRGLMGQLEEGGVGRFEEIEEVG